MIDELKLFTQRIENFDTLKLSEQLEFFAYFLVCEQKQNCFTAKQISVLFTELRLTPYSNIAQYLNSKTKGKKGSVRFIKNKDNSFHFVSTYEKELAQKIQIDELPFINFTIDTESLDWKPQDIPFLNSKIKKNAEFFTRLYYLLYHLENSIRKFLTQKLSSSIGSNWENELLNNVELTKAQSIRKETNLSEMLSDRGDSILYYCMWDDYGKIIKQYPTIFNNQKDCDEIIAHLNTLAKVRNAIAHNTVTIPQEYQEELTLFLKKYIKIVKPS
jgi:hypothetical protein